MSKAAFIVSPALWQAGHGPTHPLKPIRLKRTFDLLTAYHAFDSPDVSVVPPRLASDKELMWFHTAEYVEAVKQLSRGDASARAWQFHLGVGDNPIFAGMYDTEALKAGGGLTAAELVAAGQVDCAFNYAGGMHHAASDHASGFCVFNDPVITIHALLRRGLRVAYIDVDAHHGDGVQNAFFGSDQVLTVSLHESGRYLFPGTGFTSERGTGAGIGLTLNVPLPPYTWDEPYLWAFEEVVAPVVSRFAPDVLVGQLGADSHFRDPLAHLLLSTAGYVRLAQMMRALAPRWIALGGGGYDVTVVPRIWALAWGVISDQEFADELPVAYAQAYEPGTLRDHDVPLPEEVERVAIRREIEQTVTELRQVFRI